MKGMTARAVSSLSTSFYAPDKLITQFLYGGKNWFGKWFTRYELPHYKGVIEEFLEVVGREGKLKGRTWQCEMIEDLFKFS